MFTMGLTIRILFILLVVSGTYSKISKRDECLAKCGDANVNEKNDTTCSVKCHQSQQHNVMRISVRCLKRNSSAVDGYALITPSENVTVQYLMTYQQNSISSCKNVSIDIAEIQGEESKRTLPGLPSGANLTDSVHAIPLNISGDKSTKFSTPLSWEDSSNDTTCAPFKSGGLNAEVTNQVWEICHVIVSWKKPCIIPEFFIVSIISNDPDADGFYFQKVSGRAVKAVFYNVTISKDFDVSIGAWRSGKRVEEISGRFSKPQDTLAITALVIVVSLPFVYIAYAYFRYRRQTQRQKKIGSSGKTAIEEKSYAVLSANDDLQ